MSKVHSQPIRVDLLHSNWAILQRVQRCIKAHYGYVPSVDQMVNAIIGSLKIDELETACILSKEAKNNE